jgi:hypothetical protein
LNGFINDATIERPVLSKKDAMQGTIEKTALHMRLVKSNSEERIVEFVNLRSRLYTQR